MTSGDAKTTALLAPSSPTHAPADRCGTGLAVQPISTADNAATPLRDNTTLKFDMAAVPGATSMPE